MASNRFLGGVVTLLIPCAVFAQPVAETQTQAPQASQALPSPVVLAAEPRLNAPGNHYMDEMAVMDAKIAYLRKETELRNALMSRNQVPSLPKLVSIVSDKSGSQAQVIFDSGVARWLRPGAIIEGGLTVLSITHGSVIVGNQDGQFPLAFISNAPDRQGQQEESRVGPTPSMPDIHIPRPAQPAAE